MLSEEMLLKVGALQAAILHSVNFSSIATDERGVIQIFNVGAERMLGYAAADVVNRISPADISDPQELLERSRALSLELGTPIAAGFEALVFKASRGIEDIYELTYIRKDGSRFPAVVSVTALRNAQSGVIGYLLIGTDNTARKRAEAEKESLEDQNRQLQKAESLGRMASAIAHHFNNQLQGVLLGLELALRELPKRDASSDSIALSLRSAQTSAQKAAEVSTQMLFYLGHLQGKREALDLSEICRHLLPMLRATVPMGVMLETDLPACGPTARANANQVQQMLNNLVTNAWEASCNEKGWIRISASVISAGDLPLAGRYPIEFSPQATSYACIEVADDGCGIPEKDIEKLFEPFFSSKFTGRGLGLPTVLGIVRAHDGAIGVQSKLGKGSVFRVFLPLATEAIKPKAAPLPPALAAAIGGTVLVVDDEQLVCEAHAAVVLAMGFAVLTARDGAEAVDVYQQHMGDIRLVLSDLSMPRMNGWEALSALRKLSPNLPVIICSGYSKEQAMVSDPPDLPQGFLSKPCTAAAIQDAILLALGTAPGAA
jgi:signal transduction histidine kinase/ActR/RegA family two-component response regulator